MTRASRLRPLLPAVLPFLHTTSSIWALRASATSVLSSSSNSVSSYSASFQTPAVFASNFSTNNMPSTEVTKAQLEQEFNPSVLEALREFWFRDLKDEDLILPPIQAAARWFRRSDEFDQACFSTFAPQISLIQLPSVTVTSIISAAKPSTPLDWLSLVILLDQIPRNVFRDADAKIVYTITDPKALELTQHILCQKIPEQTPVAYRLAYRFWFYLPLEHSEDPAVQVQSVEEHEKMFKELRALVGRTKMEGMDEDTRRCREVLVEREGGVEGWTGALMKTYVLKHKELIDRFGRFPHRNECLGRELTEEEVKFLEEGGETFGGGKRKE